MKRFFLVLAALAPVLVLGACVQQPKPQLVAEPDSTTLRLAVAADRAANALDQLAAIESTRTPVNLPPLTATAPAELRRGVTINWIGPVEPLVKQLADRASYEFKITGNAPEAALVTSVNARHTPVIEILRDVGLQLGGRGELKVDANLKTVELSYGNVQTENP
jgi:defect-in-organelle-trafficking protein DotD